MRLPLPADDPDWPRFLRRWLLIGLALHLVSAWLSIGFYHSDEHFQILEFLGWKVGLGPSRDLPLEFHHRLRPWLQPAFYYALARFWTALGATSPFAWATGFRFASSLLSLGASAGLALCAGRWFSDARYRRWAVIALTLAWYVPAFHARHSSENVGGALFALALSVTLLSAWRRGGAAASEGDRLEPGGWAALAAGALAGAAFEVRYQTAFLTLGLALWLVLIGRARVSRLLPGLAGAAALVALGTALDRWGYGEWTFAPWNYFHYNLIAGHVGDIDTQPWWDFFRSSFTETWPPLGFLMLVSWIVAWARNPRHVLTWAYLPLFLVHVAIGHKELRFLFPIAHAGPVLAVLAVAGLEAKLPARAWRVALALLCALDLLALAGTSVAPAWMPVRFYERLSGVPSDSRVFYSDGDPFLVLGTPLHFYRPTAISLTPLPADLPAGESFYFSRKLAIPGALANRCELEFSSLPPWVLRLGKLSERVSDWSLYRCR